MRGAPYDIEHRIVVGGNIKWVRERAEGDVRRQGRRRRGDRHRPGRHGTQARRGRDPLAQRRPRETRRRANRRARSRAQRETAIGFRIQQMLLLDRPPLDVPGLRVAALTIPSQQIDGDFYDFYQHEDQCLDLIVADVMGKGIPAALLGAATKSHFLEALCHLMGCVARRHALPQPKEIVTLAHADMVQHLIDLESFVTLCYVRFDLGNGAIDFGRLRAHRADSLPRRDGRCELLHGDNLPLGVREGEIYDQHRGVPSSPATCCCFYSDGVTETRDPRRRAVRRRPPRRVRAGEQRPRAPEALSRPSATRRSPSPTPSCSTDDLTCVAIRVVERELPLARVGPRAAQRSRRAAPRAERSCATSAGTCPARRSTTIASASSSSRSPRRAATS